MSIIRFLDIFSLPELFKLIENESKSGRLIVETPISQTTSKRQGIYYVWFENGYLIAFSNCLNQKGLINLIAQREWLSPPVVSRLRKLCPAGLPLGAYLSKMKLLNQEKLNLLFQLQLHQVYSLFQMDGGRFRFDDLADLQDRILTIPWLEMTGHRIRTSEVSMYALRLMEQAENVADQLPSPNQILCKVSARPHLKLTKVERQVWDLADGNNSLLNIAKTIEQSLFVVQTTAFRLIAVGLVDGDLQFQANEYEILSNNDLLLRENIPSQAIALNQPESTPQLLPETKTSLLDTLGNLFKKKTSS